MGEGGWFGGEQVTEGWFHRGSWGEEGVCGGCGLCDG
jgi:hypothetical protein